MIVRLLGEGQFRVDDALLARLNELDDDGRAGGRRRATSARCGRACRRSPTRCATNGEKLADDDLSPVRRGHPARGPLARGGAASCCADEGFIPDCRSPRDARGRPRGAPAGRAAGDRLRAARGDREGALADGEVLVRNVFVSVDPYMRGRMTRRAHVRRAVRGRRRDRRRRRRARRRRRSDDALRRRRLGALDARLARGGSSRGRAGCASSTRRSPRRRPRSACSACRASPPGSGCVEIGDVKEGETVYVSGAAGAVGSVGRARSRS